MDTYDVKADEDLGEIVLLKIEKKKYWVYDDWYCRYITIKTPSGDYQEFPCFRWLVDDKEVVLCDGRGFYLFSSPAFYFLPLYYNYNQFLKSHVFVWFDVHFTARLPQDDKTSTMKQHRHKELELRKKNYRWAEATLPLLLLQIII